MTNEDVRADSGQDLAVAGPGEAGEIAGRGLSRPMALLFALTCGLSVANIYFAQPLLDAMAQDFGIAPAAIGMVMTITQVGYAFGLILIVPLGDLWDRRRLIVGQTTLSAIALLIVATASHAAVLLAGMALVGMLAVVIQVLVALAATLASPPERGRAIGTVTSGVVAGVLLARFASGTLADIGGWRLVYLVSAGLMLAMAALLLRVLPHGRRTALTGVAYLALLRSTAALFVEERILRERALFAFLIFANLNLFWNAIVLPLSAPPIALSHTSIGALGIAGVAGALAARNAGRLADLGWGQRNTGLSLLLMLAAWAPIACLQTSLWLLIAGVIMLDFAIQAVHVTSQSLMVAARPDAASRLVGGYMVFYSIGSATGAIASTIVYAAAGWSGVCILGAGTSAAALLVWVITASRIEAPAGCAATR
ncbi:putative MFS family arabinose efflux permease [Bradyrhizobium japonicum]|nr:putative MFS family arabinose efflux permease [Bradyrhizobium japonicum]MCP1778904.1 putative MFS family arabinose efflux permease [Bradyrhizobium japonicum]MCP1858225.1 putative MFS family arabinose efflux permease [Bradyrhizobium japonicum]MCP1889038.1 putative MFS family arabinose efflux permease [Bradyrhizobium japonicum]MCP1958099.1 putative MFS family arabinose efflux permease [Bradyrhizobium japonicum]